MQTETILHQFLVTLLTLQNGLKLLKVTRRHFHELFLEMHDASLRRSRL